MASSKSHLTPAATSLSICSIEASSTVLSPDAAAGLKRTLSPTFLPMNSSAWALSAKVKGATIPSMT
jgi:hypothetical protein